ncbi:MAG: tetratricopeptide repeat protein, partial [Chloroflexi bacterium]|nr:tetratricopeptide repeat protein [Chloroflexota bacterium]
RPGIPLDGALVIRCNQVAPLDIPAKLASWLAARGVAGHAEAAGLLLDSRVDPADRTRQALAMLGGKRYLVVFDNFESVMAAEDKAEAKVEVKAKPASASTSALTSTYRVADATLAGFFEGLLDAQWRGMCLFTGRYRWAGLDERLGRGSAVEVQLPGLTLSQAVMLMDNLPRLRRQPLATKTALYRKVGGHPKSIELLEGWLASGQVTDLLADGRLDGMLADQWAGYFLDALLARLTAAERDALTRLCIFDTALDDELLAYAEIQPAWVSRWLDLSLLQREGGGAPAIPPHMQGVWDLLPDSEKRKFAPPALYTVHPVVREYLLRNTQYAIRDLHEWAAEFYGRPFVEMARRYAAQSGRSWTEEEIQQLARYHIVEANTARTDHMAQARAAMGRALAWRDHLFAAGAHDPADDIVNAVYAILARWGQRDRAKALLAESIATLEGGNKAVAQGNLATLLKNEGKLAEALATYEAVYQAFQEAGARSQMAAALAQISYVYQDQGEYDKAIEKSDVALTIRREIGDEEGQAISLHQLSILYMLKEDYGAALARSQEAEALFRKLGREVGVASNLHEQGLIYNRQASAAEAARAASGDAEAAAHRQAAFDRFTESLAIERRIGNEAGAADELGELGKLLMDAGRMREA